MWDAIVVGAGPAGCATAYDLASAGRRILLLDKADFPRPKACAGGLTLKSLKALRYSVRPVIRQEIATMRLERDRERSLLVRRRTPYCAMTVRAELDEYCFRRTLTAGAIFHRISTLSSVRDSAEGIEVVADGEKLSARYLVGADGVHSQVRRLSGLDGDWFYKGFALETTVPEADAAKHDLTFDFETIREGYGWVFPKGDHLNVGLYCWSGQERIDRRRLAAYLESRYGNARGDEAIGQYVGFGAAGHRPDGRSVLLIGDAGGFVDPLTGEGIYFAVASGQAAAAAIHAAMKGKGTAASNFLKESASLRSNLRASTSAARWFYSNLDQGYRLLSLPLLQKTTVQAYANGLKVAWLAGFVKNICK